MSAESAVAVRRLNWGCGTYPEPGWLNSDQKDGPGIDLSCDIREGLPLPDDAIDYAVTIHALPEVPFSDLVPTLRELHRVLRPGGVLRVSVPDLVRGVQAYLDGDRDYFLVPDDHAESLGGKLVTQLVWYGWTRSLFTADFLRELLMKAGFSEVRRCRFGETASPFPEIVSLDNRERESLFVEAVK
jgi:predicted SAM-dependent methyltransferase